MEIIIKNLKKKKANGFTMIELLVACALFTTFLVISVGSFTRILQVQKALSRRIIITSELSAIVETISREVRMGYGFPVEVDNEPASRLAFKSFSTNDLNNPKNVEFIFDTGKIKKNDTQITSDTIVVKSGKFIVNESDCAPWRVTFVLSAYPRGHNVPEETVNLQTTVTSRILPSEVKGDPYKCKEM